MKKAILGVLVGLAAAYAFAQGVPASGPVGRYQISAAQGEAWKVDTATGTVWRCKFAIDVQCDAAK